MQLACVLWGRSSMRAAENGALARKLEPLLPVCTRSSRIVSGSLGEPSAALTNGEGKGKIKPKGPAGRLVGRKGLGMKVRMN